MVAFIFHRCTLLLNQCALTLDGFRFSRETLIGELAFKLALAIGGGGGLFFELTELLLKPIGRLFTGDEAEGGGDRKGGEDFGFHRIE